MKAIKFEFPDAPPKEQIKMIQDMIDVIKSTEKLTGQEGATDLTPMYDKIKELASNKAEREDD